MSSGNTQRETPDIETSSDDYARRFAGPAGEYFLSIQEKAFQCVLPARPDCSVLDVGGGHGQLVPIFINRDCELTIFGSDESTHRRVREAYPDATIAYATGDVLKLPYEDNSFDIVVAVRLISHIEAWETLLKEFCRVARHSIIIDYPSWISLNALTPVLFSIKKRLEGNTRTYKSFSRWQLSRVLRQHDFKVACTWNQFVLPMFLHRALHGTKWLQVTERGFRGLGLTALLGSPAVMRADRVTRR